MHGGGMAITIDSGLLRLLQLSSPALPVGGYAFSQGIEYAVDTGWLTDRDSTTDWLRQQLAFSLGRVDVPLLLRQHRASLSGDRHSLNYNNALALACRETAELRLTDTAMGQALARLLGDLEMTLPAVEGEQSFVTIFAYAAAQWGIDEDSACRGYLWSWLENQTAAATKLVPHGQTAAQQLISLLQADLEACLKAAKTLEDIDIGGSLPALALASCRHESQYSRLFRS